MRKSDTIIDEDVTPIEPFSEDFKHTTQTFHTNTQGKCTIYM